jgi:hypothetical protein
MLKRSSQSDITKEDGLQIGAIAFSASGEGGSTFAPCRLSGTAPILRHAEVWYGCRLQGESGSRSDIAKLFPDHPILTSQI